MNESLNNVSNTSVVNEKIYKHFLKIFQTCLNTENYYIIDFKCGEDESGEPLRWTVKDLADETKTINRKNYLFIDCLQMNATIKIDRRIM